MPNITVKVIDQRLNEYVQQADTFLAQGKFDHALAQLYRGLSLAEVLKDGVNLKEIRLRIARALNNLGQAEQVIEWCEMALEEPLEIEMRCCLVELKVLNLLRLGNYTEARAVLEDLQQDENPFIRRMVFLTLGLMNVYLYRYLQLLTLDKAEEYLKEAEKINKDMDDAGKVAGQIHYYFALKYIEEGLFYYAKERLFSAQQIIDNKVSLFHIYNELGRVSVKLMEYEEAYEYFEKARNLAMQHSYHYGLNYNIFYRAYLYVDLLQIENACSHFLTSLYDFLRKKHYPDVAYIYYLLSQLYQSQNSEKSEKYMEEWNNYVSKLNTTVDEETLEENYQWMSS